MEVQQLHRDGLIDHIQLVIENLSACLRFYATLLDALEIPMAG
ncbi:hypothetical protein [Paracoccus sp. S-4012]|nr:hypothetical protein [Paracoccus sp. S-4012]